MQTFQPPPTADEQKQLHRLYRQRMGEAEAQFLERMGRDAQDLERSGYTLVRRTPKIGRNDPCPCGSGKKFKKCHINAPEAA